MALPQIANKLKNSPTKFADKGTAIFPNVKNKKIIL